MRYACAVLFLCCIAAPANAATPPPQEATTPANVAITGWKLECDPGKTALACQVLNSIQTANGALVIGFSVQPAADGKTSLTIKVPLEASVRTPIGVSVTGGASQSFQFLTCSPQGCFATGTISADLLAAMRAAKGDLKVAYVLLDASLTERTITATIPLAGFAQVYDKLK